MAKKKTTRPPTSRQTTLKPKRSGTRKSWSGLAIALLALTGGGAWWLLNENREQSTQLDAAPTIPPLSDIAQLGQAAFQANCSQCHGLLAQGTDNGPPLIHKIYEPNHHGDGAFHLAARRGVRQHHWNFGNMPAIPNVTAQDVDTIVAFIREVQSANGIR